VGLHITYNNYYHHHLFIYSELFLMTSRKCWNIWLHRGHWIRWTV